MNEPIWQPIESAPKDGTLIAVWDPKNRCIFFKSWAGTYWLLRRTVILGSAIDGKGWLVLEPLLPAPPTHWFAVPKLDGEYLT